MGKSSDKAKQPEKQLRFRANPTVTAWEIARVLELIGVTLPESGVPRDLRRHFEDEDERNSRLRQEARRAEARRLLSE